MSAVEGLRHPWIDAPLKKMRLGSDADLEIIQNRLRNHSCIEAQAETPTQNKSREKVLSQLKEKKDIFEHKKTHLRTKGT